ncbi:membrane fusion protein, multidrug efflux system [Roseivivax lentus]|uniref:Membrane fusion protein, multidrug efflux system n=1 Tax=Roseivivax lentus TaxID=633194 RepID=A0A1N7PUJ0_9RHOB|nr:efflux RND transporter periplasmic adaptor subunit [Roseivivax lentus]SIT14210.1 membrane fusion protein, multidrug efflux system [Roseivivax lentus]
MKSFLKVAASAVVVAGFAAAGLFGTEILVNQGAAGAQSGRERPPTRVGVAEPQRATIEDSVSAVGTLMPVRAVALVPEVPGRVAEVPVSSGQSVAAGDLVVQLDDRAARADLAEAEATLREARLELQRVTELSDSNIAAEARLESTRAAYKRAEAALQRANAALEDRRITAPFGGTLGIIDVEPGAFLDGSVPVTRLSDLSVMQVSLSLPERYFQSVTPGLSLTLTTPAYPDEEFEGKVTVRAPEIDLNSRSFDIRAEIDNTDGRLAGGMFANSRIVLSTYEGLAIPDDAVISEGFASYVYVVSDGTAARTEIEPGNTLGGLIEARSGLNAGDKVVIAGWDRVSDGAPVTIDEDIAREGLE